MKLEEMTWGQVGKAVQEGAVAVLPIGATEQHGHMPIGCDALIAEYIADVVVDRLEVAGILTVRCPLLPFGMSEHHTAYPGTMSLSWGLFVNLVEDILKDLIRSGFKIIVICNGHGGNHTPIEQAMAAVKAFSAKDLTIFNNYVPYVLVPGDLQKKFPGRKVQESNRVAQELAESVGIKELSHADECESSMLFSFRPELFERTVMDEIPKDDPRLPDLSMISGVRDPQEWKEKMSACAGGKGDPRYKNAKLGGKLLGAIAYQMGRDAITHIK